MNTIIKNLISLASDGAFASETAILPMSAFKWGVLYKIAVAEDVAPYVYRGLLRHEDDKAANIPQGVLALFAKAQFSDIDHIDAELDITATDTQRLTYVVKKYQLKDIVYKERHSIDTSKTSLDLLALILQNTDVIFRNGIRLRGIVELGVFLRTKGQYVDFVKIEQWLKKLKLRRMATLQASVLISCFAFEEDEFPYCRKTDKKAEKFATHALMKEYVRNKYERRAGRYNISNCFRFRKYSRSESLSKAVSTVMRSLSEIEE